MNSIEYAILSLLKYNVHTAWDVLWLKENMDLKMFRVLIPSVLSGHSYVVARMFWLVARVLLMYYDYYDVLSGCFVQEWTSIALWFSGKGKYAVGS